MYRFRKLLTKEQIFTVPNFMSLFRLLLLPFIIWIYLREAYDIAAGLVLLSALTDVLDGVVARKCNMVSDLGKVLDPVCDKLTQATLLICLLTRYHDVWMLFTLFAVKELMMLTVGAIAVRRSCSVPSAKWYGKVCTAFFEGSMIVLILFPEIPARWAAGLLIICGALLLFSLVMYMIYFVRLLLGKRVG